MLRLHLYCFRQQRLERTELCLPHGSPPAVQHPSGHLQQSHRHAQRCYCIQQGQQHLVCQPLAVAAPAWPYCSHGCPQRGAENPRGQGLSDSSAKRKGGKLTWRNFSLTQRELQSNTTQTAGWHPVKHVGQCESTALTQDVLQPAIAQGCPQLL